MRYAIILVCYVLFGICSLATNDFENNEILNQDVKDVNENAQETRPQNNEVVNRERRSIWADIINHMGAVIDNFRGNPLLAGATNDVEHFNTKFNNKLKVTDNSPNVMKMFKTEEQEEADRKSKAMFKELSSEVDSLIRVHKVALAEEQEVVDWLLDLHPNMPVDKLLELYTKGAHHKDTSQVITIIFQEHPAMKKKYSLALSKIKALRREIQLREGIIQEKMADGLAPMFIRKINEKLADMNNHNELWLAFPNKNMVK